MTTSSDITSQIVLKIDTRETQLIESLRSEYLCKECGHLTYEVNALDVGDVLFQKGNRAICLIERKTLNDYASSIVDKRSKNQVLRIKRLREDHPKLIVIYLIEGNFLSKDYRFRGGITRDILYSSIVNRVIRERFIIYRTQDINDTALFVAKLYDKLLQQESTNEINDRNQTSHEDAQMEYLKTIKLAKKDNMTPDNCYLCQLAQIPGLSLDVSKIISQQYPTMHDLIMAYEQSSNCEQMLADLTIPLVGGKTRRLGPIISQRIYEYLYGHADGSNSTKKKIKITLKMKV